MIVLKETLLLIAPPPRPKIPTVISKNGDIKEVNCTVKTHKAVNVSWYSKGIQVKAPERRSNTLDITKLDGGKYVCKVRREDGATSQSTMTIIETGDLTIDD